LRLRRSPPTKDPVMTDTEKFRFMFMHIPPSFEAQAIEVDNSHVLEQINLTVWAGSDVLCH
ncbi:MAG: hypothetical protein ACREJN_06545, partial [Nitrospiraceae bacterium]